MICGARSLSGPAGGARRASWSRGLLLGALVGLVARFVASEANKRHRATVGPLCRRLAVVAASSLVLPSVCLVVGVVVASPTVVPARLTGARTETTSWWQGWRIPCLLERPVPYLVVGFALLLVLSVFPSHPLSLHSNGTVNQTAERWVLASHHNLTDAMV
jgi:hypothetical protein